VEFYDLRVSALLSFLIYSDILFQSADEAHGKLRHQSLQDGILETEFAFLGDNAPPGPAMQECVVS
jgi:hypothetical protein